MILSPKKKLKKMLMQNFGRKTKSIMVFLKKAYVHCEGANHNPFPRYQELSWKLEHD